MRRSTIETGFLGHSPPRRIRRVGITAPLRWIHDGFLDFLKMPMLSLMCGAAFTGTVYLTASLLAQSAATTLGYAAVSLVLGTFLIGGPCAGSRHLYRNGTSSVRRVLGSLWQRKTPLVMLALMFAALITGWFQLSANIVVTTTATSAATEANLGVVSAMSWVAIGSVSVLTALMALILFGVSAIALPLIIDCDDDFLNAMLTSIQTILHNPAAMMIWMLIIVATVVLSMLVTYSAMLFLLPVIGHAAWHSYTSSVAVKGT